MEELKTPPHNAEAERAVLGSILQDTVSRNDDRVMDMCLSNGISGEAFFDAKNRVIFEKMSEMNANAKTLDAVTLSDELRAAGKLEFVGGLGYLQALMDEVPTTAHAERYIEIVRSKYLRRVIIERAAEVAKKGYDEREYPDVGAVLGEAEKTFLEIDNGNGAVKSWEAALRESYDRIDRMFESGGHNLEGLSTGLKHLDERLQGLKPSEMIVIAARPSVGKTSLAMNIAESCALGQGMDGKPIVYDGGKKHPVGIFSLEMPTEALTKRMLGGRARINMWKLNRNQIHAGERKEKFEALQQAMSDLRKAPIYVDDSAALDIMDLRARARRMKKQYGIELIVIDYLQLCSCRAAARQGSRQIEVSMISQQIKAMAKELKIPVIVLSQLSRANEQRADKYEKPKLSDLRDSGAIEQDADVVFLLRRPSRTATDPESNDETLAYIDVAKNRNGETGDVKVNFFREYTRFEDRPLPAGEEAERAAAYEPPSMEQPEFVNDPMS